MLRASVFCVLIFTVVVAANDRCIHRGGICKQETSCKNEITLKGLCPSKGEECCIDGPKPHCYQDFGGECISVCPEVIRKPAAKNCAEGLHCCVWLY